MNDILIDASYVVALGYPGDPHHTAARVFAMKAGTRFRIPDIILAEAFYTLRERTNVYAANRFAESLSRRPLKLTGLTEADFVRAVAVMRRYEKSELDFADACLTALGERLGITEIATFDRRDFSIVKLTEGIIRPAHVSYFTLLP
jgi:uncharacterized protein